MLRCNLIEKVASIQNEIEGPFSPSKIIRLNSWSVFFPKLFIKFIH